jgi:hypothetical protein
VLPASYARSLRQTFRLAGGLRAFEVVVLSLLKTFLSACKIAGNMQYCAHSRAYAMEILK